MHEYFENKVGFKKRHDGLKKKLNNQNVVLCFSGGLDSTGAISTLKYFGAKNVLLGFINRGQSNYEKELSSAREIIRLSNEFYSGISLVELEKIIPSKYVKKHYTIKQELDKKPVAQYSARNIEMMIPMYRLAMCESEQGFEEFSGNKFSIVSNGNVSTDTSFGDGSINAYNALSKVFSVLNPKHKIKCVMPFLELELSKKEAFAFSVYSNPGFIDVLNESYSCWMPESCETICGVKDWCAPCKERRNSFEFAKKLELLI